MKGYVENVGMAPMYAFKRVINRGEKIEFDELLKRFGNEVDINCADSEVFANWLANNKFIDRSKWKIVVEKNKESKIKQKNKQSEVKQELNESETEQKIKQPKEKPEQKIEQSRMKRNAEKEIPISKVSANNREIIKQSVTGVSKKITVDDIVNLKIGELRTLEKFNDEKLLRAALKKAEGMTRKAVLCNAIRDRLSRLSIR